MPFLDIKILDYFPTKWTQTHRLRFCPFSPGCQERINWAISDFKVMRVHIVSPFT